VIDLAWQRPIASRYTDPLELVWMATCRRLGLTIRRNPAVFSMTDGSGLLELGPREALDPDDTAAQQLLHEICHWITNGEETFHARDWGLPLTDEYDERELACLRVQAHVAGRHGLRVMFGPTGVFRQYYDRLPDDALRPLDDGVHEARVCDIARDAIARSFGPPWAGPLDDAFEATRRILEVVTPFLTDYQSDVPDDDLPSLWSRRTT
jgi:hypothetical protein